MRELLGGKGANLAEMTGLGMPVPQRFHHHHRGLHPLLRGRQDHLSGYSGSDPALPRSSFEKDYRQNPRGSREAAARIRFARVRASMPGMMDTILNLGMNDEICEAVAKLTNNPRFARDSYRRFIQMFSDVVMELPKSSSSNSFIDQVKDKKGVKMDNELDADDMSGLDPSCSRITTKKSLGEDFPAGPEEAADGGCPRSIPLVG
ncbi:MAG: hypothetical protein ACLR4Z_15320 [Butyricicoccaceae bacterium]